MRLSLAQAVAVNTVIVLLVASLGYLQYTSLGVTHPLTFSSSFSLTAEPGEEISPPPMLYSGTNLVCIEANSTAAFSMIVSVESIVTYHQTSNDHLEYCTILNNQSLSFVLRNISVHRALIQIYYEGDGKPLRNLQMSSAPLFTLLPLLWIIVLSSMLRFVRVPTIQRRINLHWIYYLALLPLLATLVIAQLGIIMHSASGGAFIQPLEYYSMPFSNILFFITPSPLLFNVLALLIKLWPLYLVSGLALTAVAYGVWRGLVKPTSEKLVDLSGSADFLGLILYYYLTGALFSVLLMGLGVYGPESIVGGLSIPYAEPLMETLSPLLWWFSLSERSFRIVLSVMTLGVALAAILRILLRFDAHFPLKAFSKAITFVSFVTLVALAVSPRLAENYYFALSAMGAAVIPFFALCIATAFIHWIVVRQFPTAPSSAKKGSR
jgi:hypothetical protein